MKNKTLLIMLICITGYISAASSPDLQGLVQHFDNLLNEVERFDITFVTSDTLYISEEGIKENKLMEIKTVRMAISDDTIRLTRKWEHMDRESVALDFCIVNKNRMEISKNEGKDIVFISDNIDLSSGEKLTMCEYFSFPMMFPSCVQIEEDYRLEYDLRRNLRIKGITVEYVEWNNNPTGGIKAQFNKAQSMIFDSKDLVPVLYERKSKGFVILRAEMYEHANLNSDNFAYPQYLVIKYYDPQYPNQPIRIREMKITDLKLNQDVLNYSLIPEIDEKTITIYK